MRRLGEPTPKHEIGEDGSPAHDVLGRYLLAAGDNVANNNFVAMKKFSV